MWFKKKSSDDENKKKFGKEYPERAADERGKRGLGMRRVYMGPPPRRADAIKCVYAGPDYFRQKTEMKDVYAGPPMPEEEKNDEPANVEPDQIDMVDVYAGPEFFEEERERILNENKNKNDKPVQPAPAPRGIPPMAPVYAGPDFFNGPQKREALISGVYAGPAQMGMAMNPSEFKNRNTQTPPISAIYAVPTPPDQPMQLVYGGPQQMNRASGAFDTSMMMAYAGPANLNVYAGPAINGPIAAGIAIPEPEIFCKACGERIPARSKFCLECGAKVEIPKKPTVSADGKYIQCACGAQVLIGQRFCQECGSPMPNPNDPTI